MRQWTTVAVGDPVATISVAPRYSLGGAPLGVDVLATPDAGGQMTGFPLDIKLDVVGDPTGTKVPIAATLSAVSATAIGNRLVSAAADVDAVRVHLLDNLLQNPQEIAKLPIGFVAQPAMYTAAGARIVPIADANGLSLYQFDNTWQLIGGQQLKATAPAIALTATQLGQATVAVWSTQAECHMMVIGAVMPGVTSSIDVPCDAPRIAADPSHDSAALVFQGRGGVSVMSISNTQMVGGAALIRPETTSPRVLFDGERYWISAIDPRGDVVVGFIDGDGQAVTMSLIGPKPAPNAYELVMFAGTPWVFALDGSGYSAYRMCITSQG